MLLSSLWYYLPVEAQIGLVKKSEVHANVHISLRYKAVHVCAKAMLICAKLMQVLHHVSIFYI